MGVYKIAAVPGDGIGHEIVPQGLRVMKVAAEKFGFQVQFDTFHWGAGYYKQHGTFMPEDGLEKLKRFNAVYFGAVGLPAVDDTLPAKEYTFKVRKGFNQYVNYRPVKLLKGVPGPLGGKKPEDIDFIVIRENTEGEFVQVGAQMYPDTPEGYAIETSMFSRKGIERVARYSFQLAQTRRKKVTNVTKSNTLIHSLAFWDRVISEVAQEFPDVSYEKMYVDAAAANFVLRPERFDVIVTTNMIGDILSDLGGAIMGSLGLGPSGNINPEKTFPSMFEPIHGSAPDIAGQSKANPIGAIWSGALLLEHLGEVEASTAIVTAIEKVLADGNLPVDLGGTCSTQQIGDLVCSAL